MASENASTTIVSHTLSLDPLETNQTLHTNVQDNKDPLVNSDSITESVDDRAIAFTLEKDGSESPDLLESENPSLNPAEETSSQQQVEVEKENDKETSETLSTSNFRRPILKSKLKSVLPKKGKVRSLFPPKVARYEHYRVVKNLR